MNPLFPYTQAFVRTPFYPLQKYLGIPKKTEELLFFSSRLFQDEIFKEAIFLASPDLYSEWVKSIQVESKDIDKSIQVATSILKYYIRAVSRPTPFGLFSCYGTLPLQEPLLLQESQEEDFERFTTLDSYFIYAVIRKLNSHHSIRQLLRYTPNTSLYKMGDDYRYVEVSVKNGKRNHVLTSLEYDEVLAFIFENTEEPKTILDIVKMLLDNVEGITFEDAFGYVQELINAQILIGDLEVTLNGNTPLRQLLDFYDKHQEVIRNLPDIHSIFLGLLEMKRIMAQMDVFTLGNEIDLYEKIYQIAEGFEVDFEKKYLINTNLRRNSSLYNVSEAELKKITNALEIVSKFTKSKSKKHSVSVKNLESFKERFYKRYEDKEVPLTVALDNELGIGYLDTSNKNLFSDLIDDFDWNHFREDTDSSIEYNSLIHSFWSDVFRNAASENKYEIDLNSYDLSQFPNQTADLSKSLYVIFQKTKDKLVLDYAGGSSSLDIITRFSVSDTDLNSFIQGVVAEEQQQDNILYSEVLHIPDDRQGNILSRNIHRQFETPFLTKSSNESTIPLQDILISIKQDTLVLRSKKWNKQIKFYNTTAHNFYYNSLPIYQFLCDLQYQDILPGLSLNFGEINTKALKFTPRIVYQSSMVLFPAGWNLSWDDFKSFGDQNKTKLSSFTLRDFLESLRVPMHFFLVEGDNQLLISLDNEILMNTLLEEWSKKKVISLKECLFEVEKDDFCNEIIVPFFNKAHKTKAFTFDSKTTDIKRKFIPGDEWMYYKIFTGLKTANKVLLKAIYPLVQELERENLIESWFFLRYNDPDFHLRLRFKINQNLDNSVQKIMSKLNHVLKPFVENYVIWKVELSTYERELERYQWENMSHSELFFRYDSELIVSLLQILKESNQEERLWALSCKCIDAYFNLFHFSLEEKHEISYDLYIAFQEEFEADKKLRKQIDVKYREKTPEMEWTANTDFYEFERCSQLIEETIKQMEIQLKSFFALNKPEAKKIIVSLIHMHLNRAIPFNPRAHELVIYGFIEKRYRKEMGKQKHVSQIYS